MWNHLITTQSSAKLSKINYNQHRKAQPETNLSPQPVMPCDTCNPSGRDWRGGIVSPPKSMVKQVNLDFLESISSGDL